MPTIVVCAACQTKLKVPENSTAKALRCPKCKGIVLIASASAKANPDMTPATLPPPNVEELEVNEAVDDQEQEFEVNKAADEEELEVNEAAEEETYEDDDEEEDDDAAELLKELGFPEGKDPFKLAKIPDEARKAIQKQFVKNEKALWAGRPSAKIIEGKAWIGLVVGPLVVLLGLGICLTTSGIAMFGAEQMLTRILLVGFGAIFALGFGGIGVLALIFRKRIGGNIDACYVVTNKRAYICDGAASGKVQAFTPQQLMEMRIDESTKFPGDGDLVFGYILMGQEGVIASKEEVDRIKDEGIGGSSRGADNQATTAVGFLNVEKVHDIKKMINECLVAPLVDKAKAKAKAKARRRKEKARKRSRPFGNS